MNKEKKINFDLLDKQIKNEIICTLEEDENGKNHKIKVQASWKDSHHFLDMINAIVRHWSDTNHENEILEKQVIE